MAEELRRSEWDWTKKRSCGFVSKQKKKGHWRIMFRFSSGSRRSCATVRSFIQFSFATLHIVTITIITRRPMCRYESWTVKEVFSFCNYLRPIGVRTFVPLLHMYNMWFLNTMHSLASNRHFSVSGMPVFKTSIFSLFWGPVPKIV